MICGFGQTDNKKGAAYEICDWKTGWYWEHCSIVAKAEEDKSQVEQEIQAQRDQFDKELDEKTQAELTRIREDGKRQVDELLKSQREKNHEAVQTLEKEYETAHAVYAEGILRHIIEV